MIRVIGLGQTAGDITLRGLRAVKNADSVAVKTADTPGYADVEQFAHVTLDGLYETACDFDALNRAIVERFADQTGEIAYCVPGDGVTDSSVVALKNAGISVEVIPSVGAAVTGAAEFPATSYTAVSAYDLDSLKNLDTDLAVTVYDIDDRELAGDVKLKLSEFYADDKEVRVSGTRITLGEVDRLCFDSPATLVIPPDKLLEKGKYNFSDLVQILEILTGENGCPWDKAQTHASIRANLVEEAFEAVEAIDTGDTDNLSEELGDLMLQTVLHSAIAKKDCEFDVSEVVDKLCKKLVFRHPHVFGPVRAHDEDGALCSWEAAKAVEKSQETLSDKLKSIPAVFPQTMRAAKVGKRATAAGIGSDLDETDYASMALAGITAAAGQQAGDALEKSVGEVLYAVCNFARMRSVDPEIAMKRVIDGYVARFEKVEALLRSRGIDMKTAGAEVVQAALSEVVYREDR